MVRGSMDTTWKAHAASMYYALAESVATDMPELARALQLFGLCIAERLFSGAILADVVTGKLAASEALRREADRLDGATDVGDPRRDQDRLDAMIESAQQLERWE